MNTPCQEESERPYPRKAAYLLLTAPMIIIYLLIATYLLRVSPLFFGIYLGLFVTVAFAQSYVCVYWQCPYIGKFAPCVGGFCLPSSQLARLFTKAKRTKTRYNIAVNLAFACFLGVILLPLYFLYQLGLAYLLGYIGIVAIYAACFLLLICPACATRTVCPGGQTSTWLLNKLKPE